MELTPEEIERRRVRNDRLAQFYCAALIARKKYHVMMSWEEMAGEAGDLARSMYDDFVESAETYDSMADDGAEPIIQ